MSIAVLLPNYNNEPYLKDCIESLLNQSFQDFKIYFVDDCSSDRSLEIIESFKSDKILVFKKNTNSGIVDTLNLGLQAIVEKYIIRMDGDDISSSDRFLKLFNFMESHPEIDVCSSAIRNFGINSDLKIFETDSAKNKANLIFGHAIGHASSIFRTETLKKNGINYLDDFKFLEDYWLFYRLKNFALFTSIPDELYLYRQSPANNNEDHWNTKIKSYRGIYSIILNDLGLKPGEKDISIHVELSGLGELFHSLNDYINHSKRVISANKRLRVYPHEHLQEVLSKSLQRAKFKLLDKENTPLSTKLRILFSDFQVFQYYFRKKLKKRN